MTFVVPFDGSPLSRAALVRAVQFQAVVGEDIVVISVIPRNNTSYARERGWLGNDEPYDEDAILTALRRQVEEVAPEAEIQYRLTDKYATSGTISNRIRSFARQVGATIMFVGSDNAGRIVSGLSVGPAIAGDRAYDTMVISHEQLPEIGTLEAAASSDGLLSD